MKLKTKFKEYQIEKPPVYNALFVQTAMAIGGCPVSPKLSPLCFVTASITYEQTPIGRLLQMSLLTHEKPIHPIASDNISPSMDG